MYVHAVSILRPVDRREPVSSYGYGVFTDTIIIAIDGGSRTSSQTAEQILGTSSSITWQETLTLFALSSTFLLIPSRFLSRFRFSVFRRVCQLFLASGPSITICLARWSLVTRAGGRGFSYADH